MDMQRTQTVGRLDSWQKTHTNLNEYCSTRLNTIIVIKTIGKLKTEALLISPPIQYVNTININKG